MRSSLGLFCHLEQFVAVFNITCQVIPLQLVWFSMFDKGFVSG